VLQARLVGQLLPRHDYLIVADRVNLRDDFIYEYIGEVVSEPSFLKRMRDYGDEGIEHFYFMMLQKDEAWFSRTQVILLADVVT
jgi:hypothetical protein